MEKTISLQVSHPDRISSIDIDNSTGFKDFVIKSLENGKATETLSLQLSKASFKEAEVCLEIGKFSLIGREVELLKEFLNQKL